MLNPLQQKGTSVHDTIRSVVKFGALFGVTCAIIWKYYDIFFKDAPVDPDAYDSFGGNSQVEASQPESTEE
jgi:hypothetical protein